VHVIISVAIFQIVFGISVLWLGKICSGIWGNRKCETNW